MPVGRESECAAPMLDQSAEPANSIVGGELGCAIPLEQLRSPREVLSGARVRSKVLRFSARSCSLGTWNSL
jgi:hypothetical protein